MDFISFTIDDSKFTSWVDTVSSKFKTMVTVMKDVASLVQANTYMKVPLDTGRLEESYHWVVKENTSNLIELDVIFDAVDPDNGFHYAEIQHEEEFNHPHRGQSHYLLEGINASRSMAYTMIETDYLSLFGV